MPFVFTFLMQENGYQLYGEGTGLKEATMAAYNELKVLSEIEIRALIEQTKQSRKRIEPGKTPVN